MIVREILNVPEDREFILENFDFFHDGKDTCCWLRAVGTNESRRLADELLRRLENYRDRLREKTN